MGRKITVINVMVCFFFSSRRRHTRFDCDWSSDVCSSDLFRSALPRFVGRARHLSSCSGDFMSPHYLLQGYQPRPAFKCFIFNQFRTLCERSEEHTSELQSQSNLVCRLLLEKKKK